MARGKYPSAKDSEHSDAHERSRAIDSGKCLARFHELSEVLTCTRTRSYFSSTSIPEPRFVLGIGYVRISSDLALPQRPSLQIAANCFRAAPKQGGYE